MTSLTNIKINVTTAKAQVSPDQTYHISVTLLADAANTDTILVGTNNGCYFPLAAGAAVTINCISLDQIYAQAATTPNQTLHIIAGSGN